VQGSPGIRIQGHSRFLGFCDELRIAEEGYHDTVRTMARKPYPAIAGMRNVQRLLKTQNPRIADVNVDDLVDNRFIRKLDESGFFERIYGSAGR
jgi:hypothetical protein